MEPVLACNESGMFGTQGILSSLRRTRKYSTKVCGTSGARYPTNQEQAVPDTQEPVVLATPGTSGACHSQ